MQSSGPTFPNTCTADAVAVRRKRHEGIWLFHAPRPVWAAPRSSRGNLPASSSCLPAFADGPPSGPTGSTIKPHLANTNSSEAPPGASSHHWAVANPFLLSSRLLAKTSIAASHAASGPPKLIIDLAQAGNASRSGVRDASTGRASLQYLMRCRSACQRTAGVTVNLWLSRSASVGLSGRMGRHSDY